jgi:hypothetical protein
MGVFDGLIDLDGNGRPIYGDAPFRVKKRLVLTASNTSATVPIFTIVGAVSIFRLWGIVTTDLGANHTAAFWRLNDQTAQVLISAAAGTTLSAIKAGSLIVKAAAVTSALSKLDNVAGIILEPSALKYVPFAPFIAVKKTAALTQLEYCYTTTDTPTTGAIDFYIAWYPLSSDGKIIAV